MSYQLLNIKNLQLERSGKMLLDNISLSLNLGEQLLLTGPAASGKTSFAQVIMGELYAHGEIQFNFIENSRYKAKSSFVSQHYEFKNKSGLKEFYYQQRYNSHDAEDSSTVREIILQSDSSSSLSASAIKYLLKALNLVKRLDAPLIQLSSGERKKLQLISAFTKPSQLMIIDNPYIGLDAATVKCLNDYLAKLASQGITIILIADGGLIPHFITHVASINSHLGIDFVKREDYYCHINSKADLIELTANFSDTLSNNFDDIIDFKDVSISYGEKKILSDINWSVKKGDKWLLSGHNGAGKSTLLSLINGDHPQAYANEGLYLFGNKRGSGESIWDIKSNIGFVSPELHWNFDSRINCLDAVLSGFFDTPGLYQKTTAKQQQVALEWITKLGLDEYAQIRFGNLSAGVQRLALLARALVKNPPLFIFDEPTQGLDAGLTLQFINLLDRLFTNKERTMIYVSHRVDQIPKCIDLVLQLEQGKAIKNGAYSSSLNPHS